VNVVRVALMNGLVNRWTSHFESSRVEDKNYLLPVILDPRTKTVPLQQLPPQHQETAKEYLESEFALVEPAQLPSPPREEEAVSFWGTGLQPTTESELTRY